MRYEAQTYLTPQEVMQAATSFFGVDLGLELQHQGPDALHFAGGGGHVILTVKPGNPVAVEFETREWDAQVEAFIERLTRRRWWRRLWRSVRSELG
jgi:hypothetical protein